MKQGFGKNKVQSAVQQISGQKNSESVQSTVSVQKQGNGQKQPKKKNRKRVAERLAAQEAEKNSASDNDKTE